MGSNISKTENETAAQTQKNNLDKDIGGNPDPRSPTPEITRTPLQNKSGSKHNITKNVDLRKTFESNNGDTKLIHNNPILSAVIKSHLQSFDPRSPTQEFERTPIVINSKIDDCDSDKYTLRGIDNFGSPSLPNNSFDYSNDETSLKVSPDLIPKKLNEFYDLSLNDSIKNEEPLGSSTASNDTIENNISKDSHKPTQLLETNFEFIEDDQFKNTEDKECEVDTNREYDVQNIPLFKIINEDPRSPSVGIERTPIVVSKTDDNSIEGSIEEMSDDLLIKVLQKTNLQTIPTISDKINSDGILIYEDVSSSLNDTPKKSKSKSNSGSRTPLSCMKNKTDGSQGRSKSANTLYDPKNQKVMTKIPKRASHIPRLKSLSKQTNGALRGSSISLKSSALSGDCENTPPHSHRDKWDKESSIVL